VDFDLTPEQREVQATVRQFVDERILPTAIENDINHHLDMEAIEGMAELGLLGIVIPEEYGGAGMDFVSEALSCEEIERGEAAFRTLVSVHVGLNSLTLLQWGSEEQKQRYLVPQARDVLAQFYHAGLRQGICTNKPLSVTRLILDTLDIAGYFQSVVGGDSTAYKKPHPLPLQTCLGELGVGPGEALMVGDSGADVGAARAAGVAVALVPDGYTGVPAESLGADLVLEDLSRLPACLGGGYPSKLKSRPLPAMRSA